MSGGGKYALLMRIQARCEGYPLDGQLGARDPFVCAKMYWPIGKACWYITGYNPSTRIAYGLVVGLSADEWGYFSVPALLETLIAGVLPVKLDEDFLPARASELGITKSGQE